MSHYDANLSKNAANYVPLTPLSFLERAKDVYPNYEAIVYEDRKYTWSEVYKRATKFASALEKIGIIKGDTVSSTLKEAVLDNDQIIMVPIFIKEGEMIRIDTENNEYSSRVKS